MIRKILFYIFIIGSLAAAVYGYFYLSKSKEPDTDIVEHIPVNALLMVQTNDFSEFKTKLVHQNLIWNAYIEQKNIHAVNLVVNFLDSLRAENDDFKSLLDDNSINWSVYKENKNYHHLLIIKFKEQIHQTLIENYIKYQFKKNNTISAFDIYECSVANINWNFSVKNGLLYISDDVSLIEKSITLSKAESIGTNKDYLALQQNNGYQKTSIYLNHQLAQIIDSQMMSGLSMLAVDMPLNAFNFTGYTLFDSLSFFHSLSNQGAQQVNQYQKLPVNPTRVFGFGFANLNQVYDHLHNRNLITDEVKKAWDVISDSAMYDVKVELLENVDSELAYAKYFMNQEECTVLSISMLDDDKVKSFIKLIADSVYELNNFILYKSHKQTEALFSFLPYLGDIKYFTVHDHELLGFSNRDAAMYYQSSFVNGAMLGKDKMFLSYSTDNMNQDCNMVYYENMELVRTNNSNSLFKLPDLIFSDKAINQLSYSLKNYKNGMQCRLNFSQSSQQSESQTNAGYLWSLKADTIIQSSVFLFNNHVNSENELCFQDVQNKFYLCSSTGSVLWKKQIAEAINSEVFIVDIFKNGKFQLLFSSANYLHLIDRNGNYVQGYPVKLPAEISSPITLLDYDKNKDYRLFVACKDKRIYNYSIYGVKTEGFVPVKTNAEVTLPIYYSKVGGSDYLITADVEGKIYVFSRKGEGRIELKNRTIENLENMHIQIGNSLLNTKLVYMDDKNNLLNKISLSDSKETIKFGDELANFKSVFTLINDDAQTDVLMFGDGAIYGYDLFSNKLFEYFSSSTFYTNVNLHSGNKNDYFLAFDKAGQKTDIIKVDGKLSASNPATKQPLVCNLYKNGKTYIIHVFNNTMNCSELN